MKNLNALFTTLLLVCFLASSYGQTREIGNFSELRASTSVSVQLIKANAPRIEYKMIKGDDSRLITRVEGDKLIVKIKNKLGSWNNNAQAKVKVYYTHLNSVDVSAGASVKANEPIITDDMDVDVSSGASVDLEVEANRVRGDASSGATMQLEGSASKANFDASSGSSIRARMLICDHVKADVSSGATITAHANKTIKAEASSGGSVRYAGDAPDRNVDSGWSGEIRKIK